MELLKKLCEAFGPSGCETEISEVIKKEMEGFVDEIYSDSMGNLICHKKGNGKRIMYAAHMDEIGLMVTFVEKNGYLRCTQIGYLPPHFSINRFVKFENGTVGIVAYEKEHESAMKQDKVFIDIGAETREEAEKLVDVGDTCAVISDFYKIGHKVASKTLDNRASCYALIRAAKEMNSDNDIYYVFTTQEEVGLRGAGPAAYKIEPDYAICIDVTMNGDTPECDKNSLKLGGGTAIKVMDHSVITGLEIRNKLIALAKKNGISYQMEVITGGGTDAGAIHTSKGGVLTGAISIPMRYIHTATETADLSDIENTVKLIKAFGEAEF